MIQDGCQQLDVWKFYNFDSSQCNDWNSRFCWNLYKDASLEKCGNVESVNNLTSNHVFQWHSNQLVKFPFWKEQFRPIEKCRLKSAELWKSWWNWSRNMVIFYNEFIFGTVLLSISHANFNILSLLSSEKRIWCCFDA